MTITVFVGDCNEQLAVAAKNFSNDAYLVEFSNFEKFLLTPSGTNITVYTSAADLPKITQTRCVMYEILNKADQIYYRPPARWSDHTDEFSLQSAENLTNYFLYLIDRQKHNVDGLDLTAYSNTPYLALFGTRKNTATRLWVVGCSITWGAGVKKSQCYAKLIADEFFNGQYVDLAKSGSPLELQADQILRSDISPGDVVLWGLTSEFRAVYWDHNAQTAKSIGAHQFDCIIPNKADDVCDETRLYKGVVLANQVSNFCQKIGAKLIMVPILCSEHLQLKLHSNPCYYQLPYITAPVDYGTDNIHPGPLQHRIYASNIGEILKKYDLSH